jgi:hypothetical protein
MTDEIIFVTELINNKDITLNIFINPTVCRAEAVLYRDVNVFILVFLLNVLTRSRKLIQTNSWLTDETRVS